MLGKLVPVILALGGLGAGVGAGLALRPAPEVTVADGAHDAEDTDSHIAAAAEPKGEDPDAAHDYVKLNNQFVVPVVDDGRVISLVVLSLTLEVELGQTAAVFEREPKIRDAFLQVLFDHANTGGFQGSFTNNTRMTVLRNSLRETAQRTLGPTVSDVLIMDIIRQDT